MLTLTAPQILAYYGPKLGGPSTPRFAAESATTHKTRPDFDYEFGFIQGRCVYAIIQKRTKGEIEGVAAAAMMQLSGKGPWRLMTHYNPDKDGAKIEEMIADRNIPLSYEYTYPKASPTDPTHTVYAVHQWRRQQLLIFHPICKADPAEAEKKPIK